MVILEGKLEDLSKKYIPKFDKYRGKFVNSLTPEITVKRLYDSDPSSSKKYFEWMVKQYLGMVERHYQISNDTVDTLVNSVLVFNNNIDKLDKNFLEYYEDNIDKGLYKFLNSNITKLKDINIYTHTMLWSLTKLLVTYKSMNERRKMGKEGSKLIYQNSDYFIYEINTYEASCFFGAGTKWCTTRKDDSSYFKSYGEGDRKLLYIISKNKTIKTDPVYYKIAVNLKYDLSTITFWDAPDKSFNGWEYFLNEGPNIIKFLVDYIKQNAPKKYEGMIPGWVLKYSSFEDTNVTDLELIEMLPKKSFIEYLQYKYKINYEDAIIKKLDLVLENNLNPIKKYFDDNEIGHIIHYESTILKPRGLSWTYFADSYYKLANILDYMGPIEFIDLFLDRDKNKALMVNKQEGGKLFHYWIVKGIDFIKEIVSMYGIEKFIKLIPDRSFTDFKLVRNLNALWTNEPPKLRKKIYEFAYKYDDLTVNLIDFLIYELTPNGFIASFNDGNGSEIEDDSYRKAFIFLKKNKYYNIPKVFDFDNISKVFNDKDKVFTYIMNSDDFNEDIKIYDLCALFTENVDININDWKYRNLSNYERQIIIHRAKSISGAKNLFNYVIKKFSFKKLANVVGYNGVFALFCILGFKKGINYMIENRIGDIRIDDIKFNNGKPILVVNNRSEYSFLFDNEDLAEVILKDELDWEPYTDVVYDWYDQVWGCVDSDSIPQIKLWIKENVSEYEDDDGDTIEITDTFLNDIGNDDLGHIIDGYNEFIDLRDEMEWAYNSAYNSESQYKVVENVLNDLESILGEYLGYEIIQKRKNVRNRDGEYETISYSDNVFLYDIGYNLYETLYNYTISNWGDDTEDYDTFYSTLLSETDFKKISIDTEVYPSDKSVCSLFNEDLNSRL